MQFDVETPLRGYKGTVGGVTFVDGRARVGSDQKAELAYFRRHGYKITRVEEPADRGDPGGGPDPESAGPGGKDAEPSEGEGTQPDPEGEAGQTAAEAAAQLQGTPYEPTEDGTSEGFDASALTEATTAAAAEQPAPNGDGDSEPLRRPAKAAPVSAWTAYAKQLGATDEELGGKTKNELVELVTQYETKREAGQ